MATLDVYRRDLGRVRELMGAHTRVPLPSDPVEFARLLPSDTGELLIPDPWQEQLLTTNANRVLLACGRQVGKSTIVAVAALHLALTRSNSLILVVARTLPQAAELTRKVYKFYRHLGRPVPARMDRQLSLELMNGSRVVTLPGAMPDNVRGYSSPSLVVIDEAGFVKPDLFIALEPMLAVGGGRLFLLSTPNGKQGPFYEMWSSDNPGWLKIRVPADECPRISEEYLAERRAELPWWAYDQEYLATFTENEESVFRYEDIQKAISPDIEPLFPEGWHG